MEYNYTPEQVEKLVSATYDSFNLVNELTVKGNLNEEETDILNRNTEHIRLMMSYEWFAAALTPKQVTELQAI